MKLLVELEWFADGYDSEQEQLDAFNYIEEQVNSAGVTLRILKVEKVIDTKSRAKIISGEGKL